MAKSGPVPTHVTYRAKKGKEQELQALVAKHAAVLRKTGLISPEPMRSWSARDLRRDHAESELYFMELFEWRDGEASDIAHQTPEVMSVWESMGPILEELRITKLEPLATA